MNIIEVVQEKIELTKCEKEALKAAVEILLELYHNDKGNCIWDKIEEKMGDCGSIHDFDDYARIMEYLLDLSFYNKLSI